MAASLNVITIDRLVIDCDMDQGGGVKNVKKKAMGVG